MFSKLDQVESRYEEVNMSLQRPGVASNQKQYRALMKELSHLEKIVGLYRDYKTKTKNLKENFIENVFNERFRVRFTPGH